MNKRKTFSLWSRHSNIKSHIGHRWWKGLCSAPPYRRGDTRYFQKRMRPNNRWWWSQSCSSFCGFKQKYTRNTKEKYHTLKYITSSRLMRPSMDLNLSGSPFTFSQNWNEQEKVRHCEEHEFVPEFHCYENNWESIKERIEKRYTIEWFIFLILRKEMICCFAFNKMHAKTRMPWNAIHHGIMLHKRKSQSHAWNHYWARYHPKHPTMTQDETAWCKKSITYFD